MRAFRHLTSCFARDLGKSARVPVPHPVFRARFGQKCARSGHSPCVSRAIPAKVRAFQSLTSCFTRVLGENALIPATHPVFRARFGQKCARSSPSPRVLRAIRAKVRASELVLRGSVPQNDCLWSTTGYFHWSGTPKGLVLGYGGRFSQIGDTKMASFGARKAGFAGSVERRRWKAGRRRG